MYILIVGRVVTTHLQILLNRRINGEWKVVEVREYRPQYYPLRRGQGFELFIANVATRLEIYVNDHLISLFGHGSPHPDKDYVCMAVSGDINIFAIDVE
ncbi:hypothetical protein KIN20_007325 [Parelaphostrongylus tenuis]|uniref:Galectin n=1 Tax=Parelaphostrongylus tenuis TaxID=148309 RepID=A0AAD5QJ33_PARTN|nr:hypothetical protein KIN20_007325 [Parelaphostrongylus tenuis]